MTRKRSEVLLKALEIWQMEQPSHGPEYLQHLAQFGLFNHMELAAICDKPQIITYRLYDQEDMPQYKFGMKFNPRTLDSLFAIAIHYELQNEVAEGLVQLCLDNGTSRDVISRLTGVPIDRLFVQ